ncbi:MAG: hypothetical protein ACR2RE_00430, partial [Geminicoccaceae bacterium]
MTTERAPRNRNLTPPDTYVGIFAEALTRLPGAETPAEDVRKEQFEKFVKTGFPGPKVETWKYSPLGPIARTAFRPAGDEAEQGVAVGDYLVPGDNISRFVFINGMIDREHSDRLMAVGGITIGGLGDALSAGAISPADLLSGDDDISGFDALNGAFADCGAVIKVDAGHRAVQVLFISTGSQPERMINPRIVIELGDGASLDLVETHIFGDDAGQLTNLVTRCTVGEGAVLR